MAAILSRARWVKARPPFGVNLPVRPDRKGDVTKLSKHGGTIRNLALLH